MRLAVNNNIFLTRKSAIFLLISIILLFVILTIAQDLIEAELQGYFFYFSESFLFSSFWWLFLPFLYVQIRLAAKRVLRFYKLLLLILLPLVLHLYAYPGLVWLISKMFYPHTFRYEQTFQYASSEYLIQLMLIYTLPLLVFILYWKRSAIREPEVAPLASDIPKKYASALVVTEGARRVSLSLHDISYFSANSPYIDVHINGKRYLHNETLKSISERIDPDIFLRIHKSTIVNLLQVGSYTSRLNGDYDLTLNNGKVLRVSRNYASIFKDKFAHSHPDT